MWHGVIAPIKHLEDFSAKSDFDFCLAHIALESKEYRDYFKKQKKCGRFVLLDNSMYELGKSCDIKTMVELARELQPSEVVAPDVLGSREGTVANAMAFRKALVGRNRARNSDPLIMGVVQGKDLGEWLNCYRELWHCGVSTIGIPFKLQYLNFYMRDTATMMHNRLAVLSFIDSIFKVLPSIPCHLLGLSDPIELKYAKKYSWVRSNDSSAAVVLGMRGIRLTDGGLKREKIQEKLDFYCEIPKERFEDIEYNMAMIKSYFDRDLSNM